MSANTSWGLLPDVVQGVDTGTKTSVESEDLAVNLRGEGVKTDCKQTSRQTNKDKKQTTNQLNKQTDRLSDIPGQSEEGSRTDQ